MLILYLRVRSCNLGLVMLCARPNSYVRTGTRGAHLEDGDALPGGQLPHPHHLVVTPTRQMRAVGAVRHAADPPGVSLRGHRPPHTGLDLHAGWVKRECMHQTAQCSGILGATSKLYFLQNLGMFLWF